MHFSHSDERLGKYTFLEFCTVHFGPARTKVNLTVIARMVARTFPKTPACARLLEAVRPHLGYLDQITKVFFVLLGRVGMVEAGLVML